MKDVQPLPLAEVVPLEVGASGYEVGARRSEQGKSATTFAISPTATHHRLIVARVDVAAFLTIMKC